jgi:hypothetical protein
MLRYSFKKLHLSSTTDSVASHQVWDFNARQSLSQKLRYVRAFDLLIRIQHLPVILSCMTCSQIHVQNCRRPMKGKVIPVLNQLTTISWRRMGEWIYRSTFSWRRHLLEMRGQLYALAALSQGKSSRYRLYRRLGGPQSPSGGRGENSWPHRVQLRLLCRTNRSQSLYRLSYPGSVTGLLGNKSRHKCRILAPSLR